MAYKISISRSASKALRGMSAETFGRIMAAIDVLEHNPRPDGCTLLKVEKRYRIRVGDYRVVYEVRDGELLVLIVRIAHRSKVYSRK